MTSIDSRDKRRRFSRTALGAAAVVASLVGAGLALLSMEGSAATTQVPVNTAGPAISGAAEEGRRLSASTGTWTGATPMSFARRWVRCGADGGLPDGSDCTPISGATDRTYVLRRADVGSRLRVRVTATNANGSATAASNATAVVVGPPVNIQAPWPRGTMVVGQQITAEPGTWIGRQRISFRYRWLRCNAAGGECATISGATSRTYRLTQNDAGRKVRFNVTARNTIASVTMMSTEWAVVTEPLP
ncbi:MAG TPA: hypothetical protein VK926_01300, partial [Gaiellaceae bacterium]|nr:hypothetical protein [Gaiellaceae bacterium]